MKKIRLAAFLALSITACTPKDNATAETAGERWYFTFSTEELTVRSAPENSITGSVGISAYISDTEDISGRPEYMWNEEVVRSGAGWNTLNSFQKPEAGRHLRFQAYYPYAPQTGTPAIRLSDSSVSGPMSLEYEVPSDVAGQIDLMTGESPVLSTDVENKDVPVTMYHRLSAIRFVTGDIGLAGTIRSISLINVHKKGAYRIGDDGWSLDSGTDGVFSVYPDYVVEGVTLAEDPDGRQEVAGGDNTFIMLPQPIPDEARLQIRYEAEIDGVTDIHVLETKLKSRNIQEWQWGKIYTYQISVVSLALEYETFVHDWEPGVQADVDIII